MITVLIKSDNTVVLHAYKKHCILDFFCLFVFFYLEKFCFLTVYFRTQYK